ncbi:MAG: hypothetical protein M3Y44_06545, partial [Actinomycetota bacterium]|nr:hypothetical protein [Actinomycetota bacterium]
LLLDGLFLHRDELAAAWDFSIFLDVAFSVSVARMAERDGTTSGPAPPVWPATSAGNGCTWPPVTRSGARASWSTTPITIIHK